MEELSLFWASLLVSFLGWEPANQRLMEMAWLFDLNFQCGLELAR